MLFLLSTLIIAVPALAGSSERAARQLAEQWIEALDSGRTETVSALCTGAFRTKPEASCVSVASDLIKLKPRLSVGDAVVVDAAAVVRIDMRIEGVPAFLWLRAEQVDRKWLVVDAATTDRDLDRIGGGAPVPVPTPGLFTQALLSVLSLGPEAVEPFCTEAFFQAQEDGGRDFAGQAQHGHWTYRLVADDPVGDRRVVLVDLLVNERPVDRVWLYMVTEDKSERLDGIDENGRHADLFLAEVLPARLDIDSLPDDPSLRSLGLALLSVSTGQAAPPPAPWSNDSVEEWTTQIRDMQQPAFARSWWMEATGTGIVCFQPTDGGSTLKLRVSRDEERWRVMDSGHGYGACRASLRDFVR